MTIDADWFASECQTETQYKISNSTIAMKNGQSNEADIKL